MYKTSAHAPKITKDSTVRLTVLFLLGIWLVGLFDLALTSLACNIGLLYELNPIAKPFVSNYFMASVYKLFLLGTGSVIFCTFINKSYVKWIVLKIFIIHYALALHWYAFYADVFNIS